MQVSFVTVLKYFDSNPSQMQPAQGAALQPWRAG